MSDKMPEYRVVISGHDGRPPIEASAHRWPWSAHLTAWLFNLIGTPMTFAFVAKVDAARAAREGGDGQA